jgi:hypothetical protein
MSAGKDTNVANMSTDIEDNKLDITLEKANKGVSDTAATEEISALAPKKDWRFWSIIATLGITAVLAAIDGTIITTALPSISAALSGGDKYVWVVAAYFLSRYEVV